MPIRPVPGDPDAATVNTIFDLRDEQWWLTYPGSGTAQRKRPKNEG